MKCDACNAVSINGIACHETGCPDRRKVLSGAHQGLFEWECRECGCLHYSDDNRIPWHACCSEESNDD